MRKNELLALLQLEDFSEVYHKADQIREKTKGREVQIRAILEFSNICTRKCSYCGIQMGNHHVKRYRMKEHEIIETARRASDAGYRTIVLQSGEDPYFTAKRLGDIVGEIKKTGMAVTLSCGEMSYEDYRYLKQCGADRYLLKQETSDPDLYALLHPCGTLENRIACLKNLKKLGYETGSGFMIGLPGQTLDTIAQDILLLQEIGCDMAGIGPFIPHPQTPLASHPAGSTELTKRAVALSRIVMPELNLPATTALAVLNGGKRSDVFSCGANVVMKKITPAAYQYLYEIYPANMTDTDIEKDRRELEQKIIQLDRIPV